MKRFAIIVVMMMLTMGAMARPIHYFTLQQATRTVSYLNAQQELMIYYGFDYEIPTYVLLNEVWMERVNSSYYELWIFGYDAYTGDEIIMPIELQGIWLFSAGHIYNAAQYLRFQTDARTPGFTWTIPPYHPYTRIHHRPGYSRSYHYNIHRHGWMPPAYQHGHQPPLPHYYMRQPNTPAPMPTSTWTPGVNRPEVAAVEQTHDTSPTTGRQVQSSHTTGNGQRGTSRTSATTSPRSSQPTAAGSTTPGRNTVRNAQSTEGRATERTATSASTDRSSSRTATGSTTDRSSSRTATGSTTNRSSERTATNASTDRSSSRTATGSSTNRSSERKTNSSSTRTPTSTRTR